jgi:hypothetical protein
MGVTFTSNIALAMPDEAELALNWARVSELQADNNTIIIDETDIPYVTYTPTIIGAVGNPSIGSGTATGEYQDLMGFVQGHFSIEFEGAVATGSGAWGFRLPFVADAAWHTVGTALTDTPGNIDIIGEGYNYSSVAVNASGSNALDVVTVGGVSYARFLIEAYATKSQHTLNGTGSPHTVVAGDKYTGSFVYKRA